MESAMQQSPDCDINRIPIRLLVTRCSRVMMIKDSLECHITAHTRYCATQVMPFLAKLEWCVQWDHMDTGLKD